MGKDVCAEKEAEVPKIGRIGQGDAIGGSEALCRIREVQAAIVERHFFRPHFINQNESLLFEGGVIWGPARLWDVEGSPAQPQSLL